MSRTTSVSRSIVRRQRRVRRSNARRLLVESLESRTLLATVVTAGQLGDWMIDRQPVTSVSFVQGPATPPLGEGSANLATDPGHGDEAAQLRNVSYGGTRIDSLDTLMYSTYATAWNGQQLPYLLLNVDNDSDGLTDDFLFFEPAFQTPTSGNPTLPNQGSEMLLTWQTWDALLGGWWSNNSVAGATPGTGVKSLADYLVAEPNATIVNSSAGDGGVRLVVGWASATDDFNGYVDNFSIGVSGTTTTYDFEPACTVYVDDDWAGTPIGGDPDGAGPATMFGSDAFATVQAGIDAVCTGGTVNVAAGAYLENIVIDKRITLDGTGSGATDTVVTSAAANTPVLTISGTGASDTERLVVSDLRLTGATGSGNSGSGVLVASPSAMGHLTFANVAAIGNGGNGIAFNNTAAVTDVVLDNVELASNAGAGLRIASAVPSFDGLTVTNSTIHDNGGSGFSYNPSGTQTNVGTNFDFSDTSFADNNTSAAANTHDLSFFRFNGNASLTNVTVTSDNATSYAIVFYGTNTAAGTVALDTVTVTGSVAKGGLTFQQYSDVSGVSLTDVDVQGVTAPWGQVIEQHTGAGPLALGNTVLKTLVSWQGAIDATAAEFHHVTTGVLLDRAVLADNFQIEDQVGHAIDTDTPGPGLVRWLADHLFVTPLSGSIQRAVRLADTGDTINVATGSFVEPVDTATVTKDLTLAPGSSPGQIIQVGSFTLNAGDTLSMELNGSTPGTGYDQWVVSSGVTLNGATLAVSVGSGHSPAVGTQYTLIKNLGTTAAVGTFAGLPEGQTLWVGDTLFSISYLGGGDQKDVVLTALSSVAVTVDPDSVSEHSGRLEFEFQRTGATAGPLTVSFTVGGSALFGDDYSVSGATTFTSTAGTVSFANGESSKIVTVTPVDDDRVEFVELVSMSLVGGATYVVGVPDSASGQITDNDQATVNVSGTSASEATGALPFTVTLSNPVDGPVSVLFRTLATGTATPGTDFTPVAGQLVTFAANSTVGQVVNVPLTNDTLPEPSETVNAAIGTLNAGGLAVALGTGTTTGTILDNDPGTLVSVSVSPASVAENSGTPMIYTFTRTSGAVRNQIVYFTITGLAAHGSDFSHANDRTFSGTSGSVRFNGNATTTTVIITPRGDSTVEPNEPLTFTIVPSAGYFLGASPSATGTIVNDDTRVDVAVAPASVQEDGMTNLVYTFTRTGVTTTTLTTTFAIGGTATYGTDYTQTGAAAVAPFNRGTIVFAPGETTKQVIVDPTADTVIERAETVQFSVLTGVGYTVGAGVATGTIVDDDSPRLQFGSATYSVSEAGGTVNVVVQRLDSLAGTVTVQYSTASGSARAGSDFTTTGGTLTFAPGETMKTIAIPITNDTIVEPNETFSVLLRNPTGGAILGGITTAVVTIVENDSAIEFAQTAYVVNESAGFVTIQLRRIGSTAAAASVQLNLTNGNAVAGQDYVVPANNMVTFAPGETSKSVQIQIIDDLFREGSELFYLSLSNPVDTLLGTLRSGYTRIVSND